jgi:hypothetical protein
MSLIIQSCITRFVFLMHTHMVLTLYKVKVVSTTQYQAKSPALDLARQGT